MPYQVCYILMASPRPVGEDRARLERVRQGPLGHRPLEARGAGGARAGGVRAQQGALGREPRAEARPGHHHPDPRPERAHRRAALGPGGLDRGAGPGCAGAYQGARLPGGLQCLSACLVLASEPRRRLALERHPGAQGRQPRHRPRRHRGAAGRLRHQGLGPCHAPGPLVRQADLRASPRSRRRPRAAGRGRLRAGQSGQGQGDDLRQRLRPDAAPADERIYAAEPGRGRHRGGVRGDGGGTRSSTCGGPGPNRPRPRARTPSMSATPPRTPTARSRASCAATCTRPRASTGASTTIPTWTSC